MSTCIDENRLIRLLSGELAAGERETVSAHLATCAACRARHESLRATWDLLGEWQPSMPPLDLAGAVCQAARQRPTWQRWAVAGRMAASVALAMAAGTAAGLLVPLRSPPGPAGGVSAEQVTDAIGLDELGGADGLGGLFAEDASELMPAEEGHS